MTRRHQPVCIEQPDWLFDVLDLQRVYTTQQQRMALAIKLSAHNVKQGGGPFGACVFDMQDHTLIAAGVNRVEQAGLSVAHAEMIALMQAQRHLQSWTLDAEGLPDCELVTSSEPCVQCFGGIYWSGIKQLVCGAYKSDVMGLGFDEGPRPDDWIDSLLKRGVAVKTGIMRDAAVEVLHRYKDAGGLIYNP